MDVFTYRLTAKNPKILATEKEGGNQAYIKYQSILISSPAFMPACACPHADRQVTGR